MPAHFSGDPQSPDVSAEQRDLDIVLLIRNGDLTRAFDLVMQRYESKVYRLCLAYLRQPAQAQDTAQESLVRLWRALPKYDGRAALSTWIYAITRNRCLTSLSQRRDTASLSESTIEAEAQSVSAPDSHGVSDQRSTLRHLVEELPEMMGRIVALYYFEEQSVAEVSELVGLPEGTIKTHLFRARARLLARLDTLGLADPAIWNVVGN